MEILGLENFFVLFCFVLENICTQESSVHFLEDSLQRQLIFEDIPVPLDVSIYMYIFYKN